MAEVSQSTADSDPVEDLLTPAAEPESSSEGAPNPTTSLHWIYLGLSGSVLVLCFLLSVPGERQVYLPLLKGIPLPGVCFAREFAGVPCPGCGLTRCFISIAHGEFGRAWHFNPAGFLLFGMLLFQFPYRLVQIWRIKSGREELNLRRFTWIIYVTVALMLLQWIVKLIEGR